MNYSVEVWHVLSYSQMKGKHSLVVTGCKRKLFKSCKSWLFCCLGMDWNVFSTFSATAWRGTSTGSSTRIFRWTPLKTMKVVNTQ